MCSQTSAIKDSCLRSPASSEVQAIPKSFKGSVSAFRLLVSVSAVRPRSDLIVSTHMAHAKLLGHLQSRVNQCILYVFFTCEQQQLGSNVVQLQKTYMSDNPNAYYVLVSISIALYSNSAQM